jgi:hypothetical protein
MKMMESIKNVNMEIESINFIKKQKDSGEYDKQMELDKQNIGKKMEVLKIRCVREYLLIV